MAGAVGNSGAPSFRPVRRRARVDDEVGPYRLLAKLGRGGSGDVFLAAHDRIGLKVAIKFLHPEYAQRPNEVERFFAEARAANEVRHPGIVQVTDCGEFGGLPYLVMELLEGETLGRRLSRGRALGEAEALHVGRTVASTLAAAHERGIVHRDIKPENVFFAKQGDAEVIRVLDFGIAKLLDASMRGGYHTTTGVMMGTPHYMSPEQCKMRRDIDGRSDVYSLGVMLFEMVTGTLPFMDEGIGGLVVAHVHDEPPRPRDLCPDVSEPVETLILRALRKQPEQRFESMAAMCEAIARIETARTQQGGGAAQVLIEAGLDERESLSRRLVREIADDARIDAIDLPTLPRSVGRCLSDLSTAADMDAVTASLRGHPLLSDDVTEAAARAGLAAPRAAIEEAVQALGKGGVQAVLLEPSVAELFEVEEPRLRAPVLEMWEHSRLAARYARTIAVHSLRVDPHAAYLAGLLHDAGKPLAVRVLRERERRLTLREREILGPETIVELVHRVHRHVGLALAQSWRLPRGILDAIRVGGHGRSEVPNDPANVVCLANALAKRTGPYPGALDGDANEALIGQMALIVGVPLAWLSDLAAPAPDLQTP